ncbi:hypothetical protein N7513_011649 [Penicillium frequentans]|nr:hypothetical protein N7513_011649 [Penicillium glabrum]
MSSGLKNETGLLPILRVNIKVTNDDTDGREYFMVLDLDQIIKSIIHNIMPGSCPLQSTEK